MKRGVTRADRLRDLSVIALLAGGVGLYLFAYSGMNSLARDRTIVLQPGEKAFDQWLHYYYLSRAGIWLIVGGVIVGIWAFWRHTRNRDTSRTSP